MTKMQKYGVACLLFFASVISFFQVDSWQADLHKLNTFWVWAGVLTGLGFFYFMYKAFKDQGGTQG